MNSEDEEFNRMEREATMRKAAVREAVSQRQWIGLTDEEIEKLITDAGFSRSDLLMMGACIDQIARLVEARLKERNT